MSGGETSEPVEAAGQGPAFERRRTSFGAIAGAYASARPDWPGPTAAWLIGADRDSDQVVARRRVLDLGAGTGKLTEPLVAAGHEVIAVDVSEGMLAELRERLPAVEI